MAITFNTIVSMSVDMAGKWRAVVDLTDDIVVFKFAAQPTEQMIRALIPAYKSGLRGAKNAEKVTVEEQIRRFEARRDELNREQP